MRGAWSPSGGCAGRARPRGTGKKRPVPRGCGTSSSKGHSQVTGQTTVSVGGGSDRQGRWRGDSKLPGEQGGPHFRKGAGKQSPSRRDGGTAQLGSQEDVSQTLVRTASGVLRADVRP